MFIFVFICIIIEILLARVAGQKMRIVLKRIVIFLICLCLFNATLMLSYIPSGSMENTLMSGDFILSTRLVKNIERYDIVIFYAPDAPDTLYVKRVIGLPGETITVKEGKTFANNEELRDDFLSEEMNTSGDGTYVVPEDSYFMMGDNRNYSLDSRFWDTSTVSSSAIQAKVFFRIYPSMGVIQP